jgi:hypothetical protein
MYVQELTAVKFVKGKIRDIMLIQKLIIQVGITTKVHFV